MGCASFDAFCNEPIEANFPPLAPFTFDEIKDLGLICDVSQGQTEMSQCRGMETVPSDGTNSALLNFKCPEKNCPLTWMSGTDLTGISDKTKKLLECNRNGDGYWHHEAGLKSFPMCCMYLSPYNLIN